MSATEPASVVEQVLRNLVAARKAAGLKATDLEEDLIVGPDWIAQYESGKSIPDLATFIVLADRIGVDPASLFQKVKPSSSRPSLMRTLSSKQVGDDVVIAFRYANFTATYTLRNATISQFDEVICVLRDGLAGLTSVNDDEVQTQIKTNSVVSAFMKAVSFWPKANPSDIWWFIIYRAYCDPFNHPAEFARLGFEQSWKRTSGWALEEIFVRHYRNELAKHGIRIEIANGERKRILTSQFIVDARIEADKVDIFLVGPGEVLFGAVHVKASFAERRTDDVPMSQALISAGYYSPLVTMDCKSTPSSKPVNRGELGGVGDKRSAKRKDIEDDGWFSACFSYNRNTVPTPDPGAVVSPVICCDFANPNDKFVRYAVRAWKNFTSGRK